MTPDHTEAERIAREWAKPGLMTNRETEKKATVALSHLALLEDVRGYEKLYLDMSAQLREARDDNERLIADLEDAAITMRNYYAGAISRSVVGDKLARYRAAIDAARTLTEEGK